MKKNYQKPVTDVYEFNICSIVLAASNMGDVPPNTYVVKDMQEEMI